MSHPHPFTAVSQPTGHRPWMLVCVIVILILITIINTSKSADVTAVAQSKIKSFKEKIEPILVEKCYDCHGNGMNEGSVAFDSFESPETLVDNPQLWWRALRMVRAKMMPPVEMPPLTDEEKQTLDTWIKDSAFGIDPHNPDPGHVTLRRLNRHEYRNTIRDLMGVDYDTLNDFPQDDTGHGFDNIGSVLNVSPLLLEKYLGAAREIVARTVPLAPTKTPEQIITGQEFRAEGAEPTDDKGPRWLSYYVPNWVSNRVKVEHPGRYQIEINLNADEKYVDEQFDYNRCRLTFSVDGENKLNQEFSRQSGRAYQFRYQVDWQPGDHELIFETTPLTPDVEQIRNLTIRLKTVKITGPEGAEFGTPVQGYENYFPRPVPESAEEKLVYAKELLGKFATRAFRRPADQATIDRLAALAESIYTQPHTAFETGIAEAMTAVLASPRFIFREEVALPLGPNETYPYLDDYSLASRLSYFLWSTMPDQELFDLAAAGKLRENLPAQFDRMFKDQRSEQLIRHFVGQWLRARDVEGVTINAREVVQQDAAPDLEAIALRERFMELLMKDRKQFTEDERKEFDQIRRRFRRRGERFAQFELSGDLRRAMRRETEMVFETVLRENRPLTELIDSDWTFLNEDLARHYGVPDVKGDEMRLVKLPADSPRGGILTQGTMLVVTSNPDRTSPVKRGLFVLDNILGTPPPPPPPNVPALEDAGGENQKLTLTIAESLAIHREEPLCSSCHNRMDPLGLALERFNALGLWRDTDHGKAIETTGQLITGEEFKDVKGLKSVLVTNHRQEFYRCLTEKLLTYALGRGIEYHDTQTVDTIVAQLEQNDGRPLALLQGIVASPAFQKCRSPEMTDEPALKTASAHGDGP